MKTLNEFPAHQVEHKGQWYAVPAAMVESYERSSMRVMKTSKIVAPIAPSGYGALTAGGQGDLPE